MKKHYILFFAIVISFSIVFSTTAIQAQDLVDWRKTTSEKINSIKKGDKKIVLQNKMNTQTNGKTVAELSEAEKLKKNSLRRTAPNNNTPNKEITLKRKNINKVNLQEAKNKLRAKRKPIDFDFSNIKQQIKKTN